MWRNMDGLTAILALISGLAPGLLWPVFAAASTDDEETAYAHAINARAAKIVAPLGIDDAEKASRIRDLLAKHYRNVRDVCAARDAKIAEANAPGDPMVAEAWRRVAQKEADLKMYPLHRQFVARLEAQLTPEQVNQVKDGMTDGIVPITFRRYRELLPNLTPEQQAEIRANLLMARECAMAASSPEEQHAWFGSYQGRINTYLSAEGYDIEQAEEDLVPNEKTNSLPQP